MASTNPNTPTISIQNTPSDSAPGPVLFIPLASARYSTLLTDLLEDLPDAFSPSSSSSDPIIIPLMIERTSPDALVLISNWLCLMHTESVAPSPAAQPSTSSHPDASHGPTDDDDLSTQLAEWEYGLLDVPYPLLFELMIAANYLGMGVLCRRAAQVVASRMRGMTPLQMRRVLCVEDDFTAEERRELQREREMWGPKTEEEL